VTEWFLGLVPHYGLWIVATVTLLSCLALPVPASLIMLSAGSFAAAGDLATGSTLSAALGGAVVGDQLGYWLGRRGGPPLLVRLRRHPRRAALIDRAEAMMRRYSGSSVFLTRWLFSPLGPWLNFAAGAAAFHWPRFTVASLAGESVWVVLYVGLGYSFSGSLEAASQLAGSVLGMLAGLGVMVGLGFWLIAAARQDRLRRSNRS
jgi:membrane protein DedA with SNARE-associated domain